jgi:hypothetical protein
MKTRKEEYIDRMTRDLKEWSATIDEYEADASRMEVVFQEEFARTIRDMKEKRDLLANRLREMEGSAGEAWITLRAGVKKAAHDLAEVFAHAGEVMKKAS